MGAGLVGHGVGGDASGGEQREVADEASLTHLMLTSCCAARFLTGHGPCWTLL